MSHVLWRLQVCWFVWKHQWARAAYPYCTALADLAFRPPYRMVKRQLSNNNKWRWWLVVTYRWTHGRLVWFDGRCWVDLWIHQMNSHNGCDRDDNWHLYNCYISISIILGPAIIISIIIIITLTNFLYLCCVHHCLYVLQTPFWPWQLCTENAVNRRPTQHAISVTDASQLYEQVAQIRDVRHLVAVDHRRTSDVIGSCVVDAVQLHGDVNVRWRHVCQSLKLNVELNYVIVVAKQTKHSPLYWHAFYLPNRTV